MSSHLVERKKTINAIERKTYVFSYVSWTQLWKDKGRKANVIFTAKWQMEDVFACQMSIGTHTQTNT